MKNLVIFGNSIFAEVVIYYFSNFSSYKIDYVACDKEYIKAKSLCGIKIISTQKMIKLDKKNMIFLLQLGIQK